MNGARKDQHDAAALREKVMAPQSLPARPSGDRSAKAPAPGPGRGRLLAGDLSAATVPIPIAGIEPRRRSWLLLSFLIFVMLPSLAFGYYQFAVATDQYVAEFRFAVRRQAPAHATASSLSSALSGANPMLGLLQDSDVVVQYLRSRQVMDDIRPSLDFARLWTGPGADWLARMPPDAPIERQLRYWRRMVDPYLDRTNGIVSVRVWAFAPEDARHLAEALKVESERLVNSMSRRAEEDGLRHARQEVAEAEAALHGIRIRMAEFRNANSMLFPNLSASVMSQVETRLRETLAELRAQIAIQLTQGISPTSLQIRTLQGRVAALEEEVARVRGELSAPDRAPSRATLATLLTEYSALESDEKLALQRLERAQLMLANARAEVSRQGVYLNTFVQPAVAELPGYPIRWLNLAEAFAGLTVAWLLGLFAVRSIREHVT